MSSRWFAALLLLSTGCRPGPVTNAEGALRLQPAELDFGERYLGTTSALALTLTNEGRASQPAALKVEGPFAIDSEALSVPSGDTELVVRFAPSAPGPASGTLSINETLTVRLHGVGLTIPDCGEASCHLLRFDLDAGACVDELLPDGTACRGACLAEGVCVAGECLGSSAGTCADDDACTIDACAADGGCLHTARECPAADPCTASFCDPTLGCSSAPLEDGTACGDSTCREAKVCFQGACVTRAKPGADEECTPVDLAASSVGTCALMRSGAVRCWGGGTFSKPRIVPLAGPARALSLESELCVALVSGGTQCADFRLTPYPEADAGGAALSVFWNSRDRCWLRSTGAVECADAGVIFAGSIRALSAGPRSFYAMREDGGAAAWGPLSDVESFTDGGAGDGVTELSFGAPVLTIHGGHLGTQQPAGCARLGDGVSCWRGAAPPVRLGAEVTEVSMRGTFIRLTMPALTRDGGVAHCRSIPDGGVAECSPRFDGGLPAVATRVAAGTSHECFLVGAQVACVGENRYGQLGDLSPAPIGPRRVAVSGATKLSTERVFTSLSVVLLRDGGLVSWGEGNATPTPLPMSGLDVADLAISRTTTCVVRQSGAVDCVDGLRTFTPALPPIARFFGVRSGERPGDPPYGTFYALGAAGQRCSFRGDGAAASCTSLNDELMEVVEGPGVSCFRFTDAGVTCSGSNSFGELGTGESSDAGGSLPINGIGPAKKLGVSFARACALERSGRVQCWGRALDGGIHGPAPVPGLLPFARDLVCGRTHCCVLLGDNAVSCWGANDSNQLGREGPASATPMSVAMPGSVEALSAGQDFTCARLRNGEVWCWGQNDEAQLGLQPLLRSEEPVWVTD